MFSSGCNDYSDDTCIIISEVASTVSCIVLHGWRETFELEVGSSYNYTIASSGVV